MTIYYHKKFSYNLLIKFFRNFMQFAHPLPKDEVMFYQFSDMDCYGKSFVLQTNDKYSDKFYDSQISSLEALCDVYLNQMNSHPAFDIPNIPKSRNIVPSVRYCYYKIEHIIEKVSLYNTHFYSNASNIVLYIINILRECKETKKITKKCSFNELKNFFDSEFMESPIIKKAPIKLQYYSKYIERHLKDERFIDSSEEIVCQAISSFANIYDKDTMFIIPNLADELFNTFVYLENGYKEFDLLVKQILQNSTTDRMSLLPLKILLRKYKQVFHIKHSVDRMVVRFSIIRTTFSRLYLLSPNYLKNSLQSRTNSNSPSTPKKIPKTNPIKKNNPIIRATTVPNTFNTPKSELKIKHTTKHQRNSKIEYQTEMNNISLTTPETANKTNTQHNILNQSNQANDQICNSVSDEVLNSNDHFFEVCEILRWFSPNAMKINSNLLNDKMMDIPFVNLVNNEPLLKDAAFFISDTQFLTCPLDIIASVYYSLKMIEQFLHKCSFEKKVGQFAWMFDNDKKNGTNFIEFDDIFPLFCLLFAYSPPTNALAIGNAVMSFCDIKLSHSFDYSRLFFKSAVDFILSYKIANLINESMISDDEELSDPLGLNTSQVTE
ncbi:hypothetical protein TRFO_18282 [Tritrichomonas foetus]|uniref:VPS9 domain-containing protein n=1 Tax=Tritrichomonas foetus TaxID=1144522 RepID=A0A1J4KLI8_9EUKA|nr:hypothetical protein TRFO_18282 [Tritrichomonas foetus]|eukprot:OHT12002.1 hypothetical protein TRFO_18282 [Tritrichomonas foetus]